MQVPATPPPRDVVPALEGLTLPGVLDALLHPAFVVTHNGVVAFANRAAREQSWPFPAGLTPRGCATWHHGHLRAACVRLQDTRPLLYAVVFHGDANAPAPLDPLTLPASLRRVALLAARGLTDREMASEAGIPLHTVRTYVKRLYARVGVHNRVELVARLGGVPRGRGPRG